MTSRPRESSGSGFPSVIGSDGKIDLAGGVGARAPSERPTARPSGDAWAIDRDRRSLPPPPVAQSGSPSRPPSVVASLAAATHEEVHREIADRFALGDYAAVLSAAELQLGRDPEDDEARRYAENSRERLEARYATRLGSLDYVFNAAVPRAKIKWLGLDPQAAFLLSLVDGQTTVAEVLEISHMGRLETLRIFTELVDAKAVKRVG